MSQGELRLPPLKLAPGAVTLRLFSGKPDGYDCDASSGTGYTATWSTPGEPVSWGDVEFILIWDAAADDDDA